MSLIADIHYSVLFFFFNDTATTEIYTLSLHDALPIWPRRGEPVIAIGAQCMRRHNICQLNRPGTVRGAEEGDRLDVPARDRKSTRLNSSHANISYAVFCLKKKKIHTRYNTTNHCRSRT